MPSRRLKVSRRTAENRGAHAVALGGRGSARARVCGTRRSAWWMPTATGSPATRIDPGRLPAAHLRGSRRLRRADRAARHPVRIAIASTTWRRSSGRRTWATCRPTRWSGISKLARVVDGYARRFQVQEKLTAQIANASRGAAAARRGRGDRGRAPVHDHPRRAQAQRLDGHQQHDRASSATMRVPARSSCASWTCPPRASPSGKSPRVCPSASSLRRGHDSSGRAGPP